MAHTFKYGRTDCDHPDAPDTNDEGKFNIPSSRMNADENMAYFADEFDMHEEWEVVSKNLQGSVKRRASGCVSAADKARQVRQQSSPNLGPAFKPIPEAFLLLEKAAK